MIPLNTINDWGLSHPWPTIEQIEQDLLLSRALCEISNDPLLGEELIFRGDTALNKLFLPQPLRYSEDLDFVRSTPGGIGEIMRRFNELGEAAGFKANTQLGRYPKAEWKTISLNGYPLKIRIEINTEERNPAFPYKAVSHEIRTNWYQNSAVIRVFQAEELIATKIRALYQRSKGRDLFDIWLALDHLKLDPIIILSAFERYRPAGYSATAAIMNLEKKLDDNNFLLDMENLIAPSASDYDVYAAGARVVQDLLRKT